MKKIIFAMFLSWCAGSVQAATLVLEFYDEQQQPLAQVVAALIPKNIPDYTTEPTAIMDQRNNMFVPGVLVVRANTLVHFPNSDDIRHHVYSFSPAKRFELRLYHGQTAEPVLFDQAGQVVLGCNIHDSMLGYIYVVESDHFGVSDEQGRVHIHEIPAGEYQLQLQHPQLEGSPAGENIHFSENELVNRRIVLTDIGRASQEQAPANDLKKLFKRNN